MPKGAIAMNPNNINPDGIPLWRRRAPQLDDTSFSPGWLRDEQRYERDEDDFSHSIGILRKWEEQSVTETATPATGQRGEMAKAYEPAQVERRWYDWWEAQGYFTPRARPDSKPSPSSCRRPT